MDKKAFIKSCHRKGYKYVEIAKFLGLSRQRIEQILRPERNRARTAVLKAKLKKQPCEYPNCGKLKTEAHHFDYSKPLEVNWLCKKHHAEFHSKDKKPIKKEPKFCLDCKNPLSNRIATRCKKCSKKYSLLRASENRRRRYALNINSAREKQKERNKEWIKNNPDKWNAIARRAVKKYQSTHPQISVYRKEYYQRNREKFLQNFRNYYQRNKEKIKGKKKEYYHKKKLKQAENKVSAYN